MFKKKFFTLIELITVIAVIGILAAIIIPNISSFQNEASKTAIQSNVRNLQTAVDLYSLDNYGSYPTLNGQPEDSIPKPIDLDLVLNEYIRSLPSEAGAKYWVDYNGKVWGSTLDAPTNVVNDNGTLRWYEVEGAEEYKVYKINGYQGVIGSVNESNESLTLVGTTEEEFLNVDDTTDNYVVSSVDSSGTQSAPAGVGYISFAELFDETILDIPEEFLRLREAMQRVDTYKGEFDMSTTTSQEFMGNLTSLSMNTIGAINEDTMKSNTTTNINVYGMEDTLSTEAVQIGSTIYYKTSLNNEWIVIENSSSAQGIDTMVTVETTIEDIFANFKDVPVEHLGKESVNNQSVDKYRISLNDENFKNILTAENIVADSELYQITVEDYTMYFYVNENSDMVKVTLSNSVNTNVMDYEVKINSNVTINFKNIGAEIIITPPV